MTAIEVLFRDAYDAGFKLPQMGIDDYKFSMAGQYSFNFGAIYVKKHGEYIGKLQNGRLFTRVPESDAVCKRIMEIANNPRMEAVRFGHKTGNCAICGRPLNNAESVQRGIGPICAEGFGWVDLGISSRAEAIAKLTKADMDLLL